MSNYENIFCPACGHDTFENELGDLQCEFCGHILPFENKTVTNSKSDMCEYCNLKPTADSIIKIGKQIEEDGFSLSKVFVCQTEEGYYCLLYVDYEGENHYIPIEYCPKCGRELV